MVEHDWWGVLRALVQEAPSPFAWGRLWAWLDEQARAGVYVLEDERAAAYLADHLVRWPASIRVIPRSMWGVLLLREPSPLVSVFRVARVATPGDMARHRLWDDPTIWLHASRHRAWRAWCARVDEEQGVPSEESEDVLDAHPALEDAVERRNLWGDERVEVFVAFPDLCDAPDVLDVLSGVMLSHDWLVWMLTHPALRLRELDVSFSSVCSLPDEPFPEDGWSPSVERGVGRALAALAASPALRGVRVLRAASCGLDTEEVLALLDALCWDGLEELHLPFSYFRPEVFTAMAASPALAALRVLDVSDCTLTWAGLRALLGSGRLGALEVLRARQSHGLTEAPRDTSPELVMLHDLRELDLGLVAHSTRSLATAGFAALEPTGTLEVLRLDGLVQDVWTLQQLERCGWLSGLKLLDVTGASVPLTEDALFAQWSPPCVTLLDGASRAAADVAAGGWRMLEGRAQRDQATLRGPSPDRAWWRWQYGEVPVCGRAVAVVRDEESAAAFVARDDARLVPRLELWDWGTDDTSRANALASFVPGDMLSVGRVDDVNVALRDVRMLLQNYPETVTALLWNDCHDDMQQISWVYGADMCELVEDEALRSLEFLGVKTNHAFRLNAAHERLRALVVCSGGLSREALESVYAAHLPELEALELWFGSTEYGCTVAPHDLIPLLENLRPGTRTPLFPKLRHLGLCNAPWSDAIAELLVGAPVLGQLDTLDLSRGTLSDRGLEVLCGDPRMRALERLLCTRSFVLQTRSFGALRAAGCAVWSGTSKSPELYENVLYVDVAE